MKSHRIILIVILFIAGIWIYLSHSQKSAKAEEIPVHKTDSLINITISSVGDLMCHSTMYNYAKTADGSYDFNGCFDEVRKYLEAPDLLLGNLETTFGGNEIPYSGYPRFNTPDDYILAVKNAGFDFLTTANNHANDNDEAGILRTIGILNQNQVGHTGTFLSQKDRDSIRILNIKGIHIAVIAYTFSTNGIAVPPDKPYLVNYCDSSLIQKDIISSRKKGADIVLVFFHFGEEYHREPTDYQKNFVSWTEQCGADIILGSHPHVIEPADFYKTQNATLDSGFVIYSMGNFLSNQSDIYTDEGLIVNIHLQKNILRNKISITNVDYIPTWVYRGTHDAKKLHIVFPADMPVDTTRVKFLDASDIKHMQDACSDTKSILNTYTHKMQAVQ